MYTKIHWIKQLDNNARIGIMARPRGNEWLEIEIGMLQKQGVVLCVSLLEKEEIRELGLIQEETICQDKGLKYINFPIADRGIPESKTKLDAFLHLIDTQLKNGNSVVIHCRMGIGRSSMIAACALLNAGYRIDQIMQWITKARGLKVPDTEEQLQWLYKRAQHR